MPDQGVVHLQNTRQSDSRIILMGPLEKKMIPSRKTILVTDSGLGGMSVFARIAAHLKKASPWQDVSLIYFNSWPEQDKGYNHFKTMDQRAQVFNNAMNAMETFKPDMILIACNTLSVVYPFTDHSQDNKTRVSGIVAHGVELIHENLVSDPDNQVIIFGTPTTIAEKSHEKELVKMGIDPNRIFNQGCTDLAGRIERNPFGTDVSQMIDANVSQAVTQAHNPTGQVYAALCCTHFGYCRDHFKAALSRHLNQDAILLNPNQRMADHAIETPDKTNVFSPDIRMQVVSRVFWEPERIDAYGKLLKTVSLETVAALAAYEWIPELFDV